MIVRNKKSTPVTITYNNVDFTIEPNKSITVSDIYELIIPTNIIKISKGVINIKDE